MASLLQDAPRTTPVQLGQFTAAVNVACWDRGMEYCCPTWIVAFWASTKQEAAECRARAGLLTRCWQHLARALAKTQRLSMKLNLDTLNGRLEILVYRWYIHLLFATLILLSYPFYHSLLAS